MYGPLSSRWDPAVRGSATMAVQADILTQGVPVGTVNLSAGSVTVDRTQIVRRKLQTNSPDTNLLPVLNTDLLMPYGNEARIWRGFTYADGSSELVPVGTFGLWSTASDEPVGQLAIQASDRMQRVSDARFVSPRTLLAGSSTIGSIGQMLLEAVPWSQLLVDPRVVDIVLQANITEPQNRDTFIASLAANLGAEVFANVMGDFVLQPVPSVTAAPVWTVDAGPGGVMVSAARTVTRDGVRNTIIVSGQTTSSSNPVSSGFLANGVDPVCADYDPASPTYWYGPFGQVPGFIDSSVFNTETQCQVAGFAALRNYQGAARSIDFTSLSNPALAEGDVFLAKFLDGTTEPHIIDQLTIPLDVQTAMSGSTRTTTDAVQTS